jgi:DnaK suppressor protein
MPRRISRHSWWQNPLGIGEKQVKKKEIAPVVPDYKGLLEEKLAELTKAMQAKNDLAVTQVADSLDATRIVADRDIVVFNLNHDADVMREVRAALRRIQDDEYGGCLNCNDPIEAKRLAVVPWRPLCIKCQGLAEQEKAGHTLSTIESFA